MFSFRQKIFISYIVAFLIFLALLFPFAVETVKSIVQKSMEDRAIELIEKIQTAPNNDALIRMLKDQKPVIFFRVSIITDERKVLYDSHIKRVLGPRFSQEYVVDHPEVLEAFEKGIGYHEDYSELLGQKFAYMAKAFDFHGKTYVLRIAFPYKYVVELTHDFQMGFLGLSAIVLFLFAVMTWFIINHLTRPIQQIITAVKPYQQGLESRVPEIKIKSLSPSDDFGKLASTLNSLSAKIQKHINTLTLERNEKEAVLESLGEGVVAIDNEMFVIYANNMALKLMGCEGMNLIGQSFSMTGQDKCYKLLASCQIEKKVLTDTLYIKREGTKLFLDIVAAPKKDETGAILVLQDKTAHHRMLEMRKDFIANASHELKTPITIIRGFAEALHDAPDLPRETSVDITGKIVRNCLRMTNLIKDLLILTDIEHIPVSRLVECDLHDMIQHCSYMVKQVHRDANIQINVLSDKDMHVMADANLMEMAFMNLTENAAKYSNPPAQITINMSHIDDGNKMKITVADKGIGIPENDLEHIFQRFYTVNKAHSRKLGGSGLGLSIVETIIEKHFGKISVQSQLGEGTTFTIVLPTNL